MAVGLGAAAIGIRKLSGSPIADPLLIALLLGIFSRTVLGMPARVSRGLALAPTVLLPAGIVFYAANNLNLVILMEIKNNILYTLALVMIVYFSVIMLLGRLLKQRKQITYLTATGSAVCGASAIAALSPAVEAEPDDVSISLLAVALTGFIGFSMIIPFISALFDIDCESHCILSGSVLQFTGMVKVANVLVPYLKSSLREGDFTSLALTIKAARYLLLLAAIPLFASLVRKKLYFPWFLWAFLAAGIVGTYYQVTDKTFFKLTLIPYIEPIHVVSWSIAMAAIGLNTDIKSLLSNNGTKAIIMAMAGFISAVLTFFAGSYIFKIF